MLELLLFVRMLHSGDSDIDALMITVQYINKSDQRIKKENETKK